MSSCTWNGSRSTLWSDPDNWDGGVPQDGDDITIPAHRPGPIAPAGTTAGSLTVEGAVYGGPITATSRFTWSDGDLASPIVLPAGASGRITVGSTDMTLDASITNQGTLTVDGAGTLSAGDGTQLANSGTLTLGDGITWTHTGGGAISLVNTGTLSIAAPIAGTTAGFHTTGGTVLLALQAGTVTVDGELAIGFGTRLSLHGATLAGTGIISAAGSATIEVVATTTLSKDLTMHLVNANLDNAASVPSDTRLDLDGTLIIDAGSLSGPALHVRPGAQVRLGPATTAAFQSDFVLTNNGVVVVAAGASIQLQGDAMLLNYGTLTLHAPSTVTGARISNAGMVETVDDGTVHLLNTEVVTFAAAPPAYPDARVGALAVRAGVLHIEGLTRFAVDDGGLYLLGGALTCTTLQLSGGYLTGHGTITGPVTNKGWIEPDGVAQLTIDGDLTCDVTGHVVVPAPAWQTGGGDALIMVRQRAFLGGSLWAPRSPAPGAGAEVALLTSPVVGFSFDRRRAADWGVRLRATTTPTTGGSAVTLSVAAAPQGVFYGFDLSEYLAIRQPTGADPRATVDAYMAAAYDNTPWAFFIMYIASPTAWRGAPFPRRTTQDALASLPTLQDQGWGIIPVYWGQNSHDAADPNQRQANPQVTATQGATDGQDAADLAAAAGIPQDRVVYLDVEAVTVTLAGPTTHTDAREYVVAWIAAVRGDGRFRPGVYCPRNFGHALLQADPALAVWIATNDGTIEPIDEFGDVAAVDFDPRSRPCTLWQYRLDVPADAVRQRQFRFLDDRGARLTWTGPQIDFDVATCADPSLPDDASGKTPRAVTALTLDTTTITAGQSAQATITLDRAAPRPLGTTVLLRANRPEAQVRAAVQVDAGATTITVPVSTAVVHDSTTVELRARTLHDLRHDPTTVTLTVTPRSA